MESPAFATGKAVTRSRSSIQQAAGLALQQPQQQKPAAALDPRAEVFGELDELLRLGNERQREHGRALVAELTQGLKGAAQCHNVAAALLDVEEKPGKPANRFAELDGMLRRTEAARAAAPHVTPFKKEMEALLAKVASESGALSEKHPLEELLRDTLTKAELEAPVLDSDDDKEPQLRADAECSEPLFAELASLLDEVPGEYEEKKSRLEASLAKMISNTVQHRAEAAAVAEKLLQGQEEAEDPVHEAWRRNALDSLRTEARGGSPKQQAAANAARRLSRASVGGSTTKRGSFSGQLPMRPINNQQVLARSVKSDLPPRTQSVGGLAARRNSNSGPLDAPGALQRDVSGSLHRRARAQTQTDCVR